MLLIWTVLLEYAFQIVSAASLLAEVYSGLVTRRIIVASRRGRPGRLRWHRGWLRLQSNFFSALGQEWLWVESHLKVVDLLVDEVQVEQDAAHDTLQLVEDTDRGHVMDSALFILLFPATAGGTRRATARAR